MFRFKVPIARFPLTSGLCVAIVIIALVESGVFGTSWSWFGTFESVVTTAWKVLLVGVLAFVLLALIVYGLLKTIWGKDDAVQDSKPAQAQPPTQGESQGSSGGANGHDGHKPSSPLGKSLSGLVFWVPVLLIISLVLVPTVYGFAVAWSNAKTGIEPGQVPVSKTEPTERPACEASAPSWAVEYPASPSKMNEIPMQGDKRLCIETNGANLQSFCSATLDGEPGTCTKFSRRYWYKSDGPITVWFR